MKLNKTLFLVTAIGIFAAGCVTPRTATVTVPVVNPVTLQTNLVTEVVTNYVPSPTLTTISNEVTAGIATAGTLASVYYPPAAPVVPIAQDIATGLFGLFGIISAWYAAKKNTQAANSQAAVAALAQHVVNTGAQAPALAVAADNGSVGTVATALANAALKV